MRFRLLIDTVLDDAKRADIARVAPDCEVVEAVDAAAMAAALPEARAFAGTLPAALLPLADGLDWLHTWTAGPDHQLYADFVTHPARMTSARGNGAIPLAEHAMMLMLMLNRNALRWLEAQRNRQWDRFTHGELAGQTLGLIGTGNSGRDLAAKAQAFHMTVHGISRTGQPVVGIDRMFHREQLHDFLRGCDVLVVTAPLTDQTTGMLQEAEFHAMKRSAQYICFSRGGIADDAALLKALNEGWIAGAGLDAHGVEPLPQDSPFWTAPNTIITPHNGATTQGTAARGWQIFAENLRRYAEGQPFLTPVDKSAGY